MPINTVRRLFRENRSTLVSLFLLILMPVIASSGLSYLLYEKQDLFFNLNGIQMLIFFIVVAFTMAFALTPTTFVALVSGFYLGWPGFPGIVIAYGIAAFIGYKVAQTIDHGRMTAFINNFPKAAIVTDELKHHSWELILLTRISPVLPFAFMTFVLSLIKVPLRLFLVASMAGMLPRTLFFFWLGTQANNILTLLQDPHAGNTGKILLIGLVIVSLLGLYYLFNNALKKALNRTAEKRNQENF